MGMALAAIADDDDLLAFDQVQVGVAIVIDTHSSTPAEAERVGRFVGVMAGLVPAIHVLFYRASIARRGCPAQGRA